MLGKITNVVLVVLLVGQFESGSSGVSVLHEKGPTKLDSVNETSSKNKTGVDNKGEILILRRSDVGPGGVLWRTENGDLVKLVPVTESERNLIMGFEGSGTNTGNSISKRFVENVNTGPDLITDSESVASSSTPNDDWSHKDCDLKHKGDDAVIVAPSTQSSRQKRTFWPFTSLFGYDYYDYPPVYGPGAGFLGPVPPYGGVGFGMPLPPPPPLLGLGFRF